MAQASTHGARMAHVSRLGQHNDPYKRYIFAGGNLFERLSDPMYKLTESKCQVFIKQILEGLEFIHGHSIVHLNIIPYNIIFLNKVGDGWSIFYK